MQKLHKKAGMLSMADYIWPHHIEADHRASHAGQSRILHGNSFVRGQKRPPRQSKKRLDETNRIQVEDVTP